VYNSAGGDFMQTIDFLMVARWILSQYSDETKEMVLRGNVHMRAGVEDRKKYVSLLLRTSAELAVVAERLNVHPHAPTVLRAFGIEQLLSRDFAIAVAESVTAPDGHDKDPTGMGGLLNVLHQITGGWWTFETCIGPVEKLVVPEAVLQETEFDEILTIELLYDGDRHAKAETVSDVLRNVSVLYAALARGLTQREYPPLVVIYADSGSDLRLDLTGSGEPIKELKGFLVELWNRFRHRRADDYRANAEALLGGLKAVAGLEALHQQGALNDEEVARCKRDILEAGIRLFEAGTLPREIPRVEPVSNQRILAEFQRKLLAAPPDIPAASTPSSTDRKATKRKRSSTRKRV
jgi:hypothetical protein